ncbi:Crp/Fnr family transcriptional regulator [Ramlibacter sp.]|uniref:Crp/Fnr family transcriptional regulator n=1 Tax=Ramlibacter sp. TaxID=1917967 RepID=UPI002CD736C6|nr:Crp/Fnr family transcriptional regulator [Ramlibacter sp.]HWI83229.1 Crp/Fnr family transcriptional regulator [Ramlibacter sp.]
MARPAIAPQVFLAALPLFKSLNAATIARLAAATTRRSLRRGERVFAQGELLTGMYIVVYGEIRLVARSPSRERLTSVVRPGQSFGEPIMFLERPAVVNAEAATDALVLHVPKQAVFEEIERNPLFARRMIAGLSQRIEAMVHEADRRAMGSGRERLIDYLVRNAAAQGGAALVQLPAPKAAVASHLHLTPEHFSRILHELADEGLLEVRGRRIEVRDVQRLAASAGGRREAAGKPA